MKEICFNIWKSFVSIVRVVNLMFIYHMLEVKFNTIEVKYISHYCNNRFAFHMHMFTNFVLSLNKLNTIIHSNIRFMVIAYN